MVIKEPIGTSTVTNDMIQVLLCESCDWRFLLPHGQAGQICPHCFSSSLVLIPDDVVEVDPELYLPFEVDNQELLQSIEHFSSGLWFPPVDLKFVNLKKRLKHFFLPVWLVDSDVSGYWQAEAGFNYQVVSHQDRFDDSKGGWSSREVTETRIRWEPRLGSLKKSFQNICVGALEEHLRIMRQLGDYAFDKACTYDPKIIYSQNSRQEVLIRLPDRTPKDVWPDALPRFQSQASENCREACSADHIRNFSWEPQFQNQNWTLLLLPVLATYYEDDDKHLHSLLIHGQTGKLYGSRSASMKRARSAAFWLAGIGITIFFLSLLISLSSVFLPAFLVLGVLGFALAILFVVAAVIPLLLVWWINTSQKSLDNE